MHASALSRVVEALQTVLFDQIKNAQCESLVIFVDALNLVEGMDGVCVCLFIHLIFVIRILPCKVGYELVSLHDNSSKCS